MVRASACSQNQCNENSNWYLIHCRAIQEVKDKQKDKTSSLQVIFTNIEFQKISKNTWMILLNKKCQTQSCIDPVQSEVKLILFIFYLNVFHVILELISPHKI